MQEEALWEEIRYDLQKKEPLLAFTSKEVERRNNVRDPFAFLKGKENRDQIDC